MQIFHNPRCTKSREALQILQRKGIEPEIINYLKEKMTQTRLRDVLSKLNMEAIQIIRTGEPLFKEEYANQILTNAEWIKVLVKHPKLIERPIVINGDKAVIGRPPSKVLDIL